MEQAVVSKALEDQVLYHSVETIQHPIKLSLRAEICEALKVSGATIERERRKGMPFIRIGKSVRYDLVAVLAYFKSKTTEAVRDVTP